MILFGFMELSNSQEISDVTFDVVGNCCDVFVVFMTEPPSESLFCRCIFLQTLCVTTKVGTC